MLACLASVVLLGKDALARSYAWGEVTATFSAVDVEFAYHGVTVALRTLHLLAGPVGRWMSGEELDCQVCKLVMQARRLAVPKALSRWSSVAALSDLNWLTFHFRGACCSSCNRFIFIIKLQLLSYFFRVTPYCGRIAVVTFDQKWLPEKS